jgi:predicted phage replisome organizer
MINMRERRYVKFRTDMYEDTKFKIIDRMSKRDLVHYVWSRIVVLAGKVNQEGDLYMSRNIPYTVETLAIEFNRDINEIKTALDVLIELEMIGLIGNKVYRVKNFVNHQNIKVKEKVEIKEKENEISNAENNKIEKDRTKMDSEIEGSFENRISTVSTEEKEEADSKANKNNEMSDLDFFKIDSDSENKSCNENKVDNESNVNQDKNEKNNISQHNNSPVVLEVKENTKKKNKKTRKKKIRDDIIELGENDELMNGVEEEKGEDFLCWITEEEMKPKEGEEVILEMSF